MTADRDQQAEQDELRAYLLAMVEFNAASTPVIVAFSAGGAPSAAEITREENARAKVVETRRRIWERLARGNVPE